MIKSGASVFVYVRIETYTGSVFMHIKQQQQQQQQQQHQQQ